jgi:pentose-5-phosphate-3-epimerase
VDGGIELHAIRAACQAGAQFFVSGAAVFHNVAGPGAGSIAASAVAESRAILPPV